jgi:hypothetical protein
MFHQLAASYKENSKVRDIFKYEILLAQLRNSRFRPVINEH